MVEIGSSVAAKAASTVVWEAAKLLWRVWLGRERVIYNGLWSISPADVRGDGGHMYEGDRPVGERGEGSLSIDGGMIDLSRTNKVGRFHIFLERVGRKGKKSKYL